MIVATDQNNAAFLRSVLAASDDCIKVIGLDGALNFMSEGGQRVMEVGDFNAIKGCPWPDFWQDQGNLEAKAAIEAAKAGKSSRFQGYANTALGTRKFWDVQVSPIVESDGQIRSILSVSRDITTLKMAEEQLRLLSMELQHRIKNTIAMIQAIASQTLLSDNPIETSREVFLQRLHKLGEAQNLLALSMSGRTQQRQLVEIEKRMHADGEQISADGPDVELSSKCTLAMALILNELGTNATKYGALSTPAGRVAIDWSLADDAFVFRWQESGGPSAHEPTHRGFGSRLIEQALPGYFDGTARIEYGQEGVCYRLDGKLFALARD